VPESIPGTLVVVGCSWGGLAAVERVLAGLPPGSDCALVVVQHRAQAASPLADFLASVSPWPLAEPEDKEPLMTRRVYVAPAGYHLMVEADHLALSTEDLYRHSRPSIDVLFESAASAWAERVVAVILTGANSDGADGARRVAAAGGRVIIQDPAEAERAEMPAAARAAVPEAEVLAVSAIGARLGELVGTGVPGPGRGVRP
jgi:two-component system chemotaxis response regulator CheB